MRTLNIIDTRDLYKRKCKLEGLRDALDSAREELAVAEKELADHNALPFPEEEPAKGAWFNKREELEELVDDAETSVSFAAMGFGDDEKTELNELENLKSEISKFHHGQTMIEERDFEEYARQYADDIGDCDGARWPYCHIDWEQAARELKMDYTTVTYQGTDYLVRA